MTRLCTSLLSTALLLSLVSPQAAAAPGRLGVMVDAGVPDGVNASVVLRPTASLQVHGGGGHNLIGPGIRAGASFQPFFWVVRPSLNVEAGHYFPGDANQTLRRVGAAEPDSQDNPMLEKVGYQYANFHLGLELGRSRATFYIHGGFSAVRGRIRNLDQAFAGDEMSEDPGVEIREDPLVKLWTPSARVGLIVFL